MNTDESFVTTIITYPYMSLSQQAVTAYLVLCEFMETTQRKGVDVLLRKSETGRVQTHIFIRSCFIVPMWDPIRIGYILYIFVERITLAAT